MLTNLNLLAGVKALMFVALYIAAACSGLSFAQSPGSASLVPVIGLLLEGECSSSRVVGAQNIISQQDISDLRGVSKIEGDLILSNANVDLDLSALAELKEVTGQIELIDNTIQTSVSGFDCLETAGGLNVRDTTVLVSVSGFDKLNHIGLLEFSTNSELITIPRFPRLKNIYSSLYFANNTKLVEFLGFVQLESLAGDLTITDNSKLIFMPFFPELTTIETLSIRFNAELLSIDGFGKLANLEMVAIDDNAKLQSITPFPSLTALGMQSYASIDNNPMFDCPTTGAPFFPVENSTGNATDCLSTRVVAFLWFDQPNNTSSFTPDTRFNFKTVGGANTFGKKVSGSLPGEYVLTFPGLTFSPSAQVQISPYGATGERIYCRAELVPAFSQAVVDCFDDEGIASDARFNLSITDTSNSAQANVAAYALVSSGIVNGVATLSNVYSSTGGAVTVERPSGALAGQYVVTFNGEEFRDTKKSLPQVTAFQTDHQCAIQTWGSDDVSVYCFDPNGDLSDSGFMLSVMVDEGSDVKTIGYANVGSDGVLQANSYNAAEQAISSIREQSGRYLIDFVGTGVNPSSSQVQVSAQQSGSKYCSVFSAGPNVAGTVVRCYNASGVFADAAFAINIVD